MSDPFSEALVHHRTGRLDQAANLYRQILAADPAHADSLNLLGVIAHQRNDNQQAVDLIQKAIQIRPDRAAYYVNLSAALRGLKRFGEAIETCRAALKVQTDLPEAYLGLGLALQGAGRWAEAEQAFRWITENRRFDSRGPQALANCLREQGRTDEAAGFYRDALARNPDDGAAHLGLGTLLLTDRNSTVAEPHLRRATELLPGVVNAWTNYGSCLVKLSREREAIRVFQEGLRRWPNELGLGVNLGQAHLGCGEPRLAENCFNAVLQFQPNHPEAISGLADVREATDRIEEALPLYERALKLDPAGNAYKGLAAALWETGDVDRAVAIVRDGIARHPRDPENHVRLAVILAAGGDLKGAEESYREALRIRPGYPLALIGLAQTLRAQLPGADAEQLKAVLSQPIPEPVQAGVHFGLAQIADARGDFSAAAEHLELGNAMTREFNEARGQGYNAGKFTREVDQLIELFTAEYFAKVRGYGISDARPVFVVGMPRSGTTLIEQILASHPQVYGAGERRFAYQSLFQLAKESGQPADALTMLEHLTPEAVRRSADWHLHELRQLDGGRAARVVDKMPENYLLLGWLAAQFPHARFIHCRRDVRDVALSCWMTNFSRIRWANDLEHIAGRVRDYQRIMEHWRAVLPAPVLDVDYEQLVADQEGESRKMVKWIGLDWDPACLAFYKSERLVKTASVTQVRQPMYSQSVGRWKHYEAALTPFLRAIGCLP